MHRPLFIPVIATPNELSPRCEIFRFRYYTLELQMLWWDSVAKNRVTQSVAVSICLLLRNLLREKVGNQREKSYIERMY